MKRRGAAHVVGIDKNPENIEAARKYHILPASLLRIDFRNQHWDDPLPEGPFDYILHLSAFHYAKNPQKLLDDMRNVLAPKGSWSRCKDCKKSCVAIWWNWLGRR